MLNIKDIM